DRERNKSMSRKAETNISMSRAPNKWLEYTVKNLNLGASVTETQSINATKADTLVSYRYTGSYNLTIPQDKMRFKILPNYYFSYFPKSFNNNANLRGEFPKRWDWRLDQGVYDWHPRSQSPNTKSMDTSNEIRYDIFSDMNAGYKLTTRRDLMRESRINGINIGQETERTQDMSWGYNPLYTAPIATTQLTASVNYRENRRAIYANTDSLRFQLEGNVSRGIKTNFVLKNSVWFSSLANKLGASSNKKYRANQRESGQGFSEIGFGDDDGKDIYTDDDIKRFDNYDYEKDLKDQKEKEIEREKQEKEMKEKEDKEKEEKEVEKDYFDEESDIENKQSIEPTGKEKKEQKTKEPLNLFADFFGVLGRLQNFSLAYENTYGTRFESMPDRPEFAYQMGLPHTIDPAFVRAKNDNDSYSASTGFPIVRNLVADGRWAYTIARSYTSPVGQSTSESRTVTTVWPDVRLSYSGFEKIIRAERFLSSSRLQSSYSLTERLSGNVSKNQQSDPQQTSSGKWYNAEVLTHSFNPLLGWNNTWVNGITSNLSMGMNLSENNTYTATPTKRLSQKITYSGSAGYTFAADSGIKLPFKKEKIQFRNQIQTDLQVTYETERAELKNSSASGDQVERDTSKIAVTPRVSYSFSRNIRGGLTGGYERTNNKRQEEKLSIFRMDFWIEFIF
ncbi:MAG: hypothetical protein FWG20_04725, partial [Candidatus Cloacimonetes bacterium]|nr:hypothetical protein [Candidatus Cloacimonadota bacterium]